MRSLIITVILLFGLVVTPKDAFTDEDPFEFADIHLAPVFNAGVLGVFGGYVGGSGDWLNDGQGVMDWSIGNTTPFSLARTDDMVFSTNIANWLLPADWQERMRITKAGNVGIGTTNPVELLEVSGEGGTEAGIDNVRIRVKTTALSQHAPGIEFDNFENGGGTMESRIVARDDTAFSFEYGSAADDVIANLVTITQSGDVGIGTTTTPGAKLDVEVGSGGAATIGSPNNVATGNYAIAMGDGATASGWYSLASGQNTVASGTYSVALGHSAQATGWSSFATGLNALAQNSNDIAMGNNVAATGVASVAIGSNTTASGENSMSFGKYSAVSGNNAIVLGIGNLGGTLNNNTDYSLAVGFNSNIPTFFVGPGSGIGTTGDVGIGTTTPLGKLDVNGTIYQRGIEIHADYVFESDYDLETIREHADFMWKEKHLKAIPKAKVDENGMEIVEVGAHRKGIVEELEKAHIYIARLNDENEALEAR
ncbi:MAG: hypothetical protein GY727_15240, partial [Gammaproteobacteria bacterium]|nr:hypothetical protein [Gammaproteobacteria bacterium]